MRRSDGRMSKKDRRAIAAFGLTPQEDRDDAQWTSRYLTNANPISLTVQPVQGGHAVMLVPGQKVTWTWDWSLST